MKISTFYNIAGLLKSSNKDRGETSLLEEIRNSGIFDAAWYKEQYPDVAKSGIDPAFHYIYHGAREKRDPGPDFSTRFYLSRNPDVQIADINPLIHYLRHGHSEGRAVRRSGAKCNTLTRVSLKSTSKKALPKKLADFQNFQEFKVYTVFNPVIEAPYRDRALYIIYYLEFLRRKLHDQYLKRPRDIMVSIIMPAYNRESYIGIAVQSVLEQHYDNWELIVVDDCSQDRTEEVVRNINDDRIRILRMQYNSGPGAARNAGLESARGEMICYLDSDNRMHPDFLLIMVNELRDANTLDVAFCGQRVFVRNEDIDGGSEELKIRCGVFNRSLLENRNYIDCGMIIHRQDCLDRIGGFNQNMSRLGDWEFILRLTETKPAKSVTCLLSEYYYDAFAGQISSTKSMNDNLPWIFNYLRARPVKDHVKDLVPGLDNACMLLAKRSAPESPPVSIIIPSYEVLSCLQACVESVFSFTPSGSINLIIVDNGSSEDVRNYLKKMENKDGVTVVFNDSNLGFTQAVNQGMRRVPADHDIILLNNDAVVTEGWLDALQEVLYFHPDAGLIVPRQTVLPKEPSRGVHQPYCHKKRETDINLSAHHMNVLNPEFDPEKGYMELSFAPFFCVYIPRNTLGIVDFPDSRSGIHYHSDYIYCDAVRNIAGRRILYTPYSKVYHLVHQSTFVLKKRDVNLYRQWVNLKN